MNSLLEVLGGVAIVAVIVLIEVAINAALRRYRIKRDSEYFRQMVRRKRREDQLKK